MRLSYLFVVASGVVACGSGSSNGEVSGPPQSAEVSVQSQCSAFSACGGDVEGTWDYTGGCAQVDLSQLQQGCAGMTVTNTSAAVVARVVFSGGSVTRNYTVTGKATANLPASCLQLGVASCAEIQSAITSGPTTAACSDDGNGGCTCAITSTTSDEGTTTYTIQGDQIATGDGNEYTFCAQGGSMTYSHVSGSSPEEGVFTLTKR